MNTSQWNGKPAPRLGWIGAGLVAGALTLAGCGNSGGSSGGGSASLATVAGVSVPREEFVNALEARHGEPTAVALVDYYLLQNAAKAKGITVTDEEVEATLAEAQKNNPGLAQRIAAGGPRVAEDKRQIRQRLLGQKLVAADVKVDQKALEAFFAKRAPQWYNDPVKVTFGALLTSTKVRADLMSSQLAAKTKSFQELLDEQQKANDPVAKGSTADSPQPERLAYLPPEAQKAFTSGADGTVTKPISVNVPSMPQQVWAIFRLTKRIPATKPTLESLRSTVELDYKLSQVAESLNKANPQNPPYDEALERTANYLRQQRGGDVTLRDVLSFITEARVNQIIEAQRGSTTVQITDSNYSNLVQLYPGSAASLAPAPGAPAASAPAAGAPAAGAPAGAAPASSAPGR